MNVEVKRILQTSGSGLQHQKSNEEDDFVIFLSSNPVMPTQAALELMQGQRGKNLDQFTVDNPPTRSNGVMFITEFLFIGDKNTSVDGGFIK